MYKNNELPIIKYASVLNLDIPDLKYNGIIIKNANNDIVFDPCIAPKLIAPYPWIAAINDIEISSKIAAKPTIKMPTDLEDIDILFPKSDATSRNTSLAKYMDIMDTIISGINSKL